jgi:hypothetical protein
MVVCTRNENDEVSIMTRSTGKVFLLILGFSCLFSTQTLLARENDGKTFSETAAMARRPAGAPGYSEVCFSSRWKHPANEQDPHNSFAAAEAFHATRFLWVYTSDPGFISEAKERGYGFSCTLNSMVTDQPEGGRKRGRITGIDGSLITAPWMRMWKDPAWGCCNHPEWRESYLAQARAILEAGAGGFQMDDPTLNLAATHWGGCFCEVCMAGFRDYLDAKLSDSELTGLGIVDTATFDYRAHLIAQGAPAGDSLARWKEDPLREHFIAFQKESVERFYRDMRREIDSFAGRRVPFSCNNYGGRWDGIYALFDYGVAELNEKSANPPYMYARLKEAMERRKAQVFTLVSEDVALNRRVIAAMYAFGGHLIAPWDVYLRSTPEGSDRYYGNPDDYADLFGFVRGHAEYFDGYEDAFVSMAGTTDDRYGGSPPIAVEDAGWVIAVRAVPENPDAAVVIHLVNWNGTEGCTLKVEENRCFRDRETRFALLRPGAQRSVLKGRTEGEWCRLEIPPLDPWGIVVVEVDREQ